MFSYFVDINMAGGQVEIRLPSGWTIHTAAENIFGDGQDADGTDTLDYRGLRTLQRGFLG